MSYHGALGTDTSDVAKQCAANIKSAQLDSKAGREESVRSTAECAAEGACAIYSKGAIPPGVCGPVGKVIAGEAIKVWNSVFGDDSAAREALRKSKEATAFFAQIANANALLGELGQARLHAVGALIELHDRLIPERKGAFGNMSAYVRSGDKWLRAPADKPIVGSGELPMLQLLASRGMEHWVDPTGWVRIPDAFVALMQGQITTLASAERARLLKACAVYPVGSIQNQACVTKVPSQRALETQVLGRVAAENAAKFLDSLDRATLQTRAFIAGSAAKEAALRTVRTQVVQRKTESTSARNAAALLLAGGAVAAVLLVWRRKS